MTSPISAGYRVEMQAIGATRPHKMHWFTDAAPSSDPSGYDLVMFGGGTTGFTAAMNLFFPLVRALFPAAMTVGNVLLQQYLSGAWVDVASVSNSNVGTAAGVIQPTQQSTITIRSTIPRHFAKFVYLETPNPYVGRIISLGAAPAGISALVTDMLNRTAGHSGSWIVTRQNAFLQTFLSLVYDTNDRVRRDGGYA